MDLDKLPECPYTLSLTEEEMALQPWKQMLTNGAISPDNVVTSNLSDDSSEEEDEPEIYFSDEENSEQGVHHADRLELREYQKELAEDALQGRNTIICAPTGSGKTRVATYIIAEHLRTQGKGKKVAFFARTVPLAVQQYKSMQKYLPSYKITHITGDSKNNTTLHLLLPYYDIVVMTPMILENHLERKWLPHLGMFSMLVFDECHHTRKGEPYNTLMCYYHKMKHQISEAGRMGKELNMRLPQILGLTASIGIEGAVAFRAAVDSILEVCGNLDVSTMSTVERNRDELQQIVPVPTETSRKLYERRDDASVNKICEIMQKLETYMAVHIRELNNSNLNQLAAARPSNRKSQEYEQWAVQTMNSAKTVPIDESDPERNISVRLIIKIAQYLTGYRFALETYDLVELRDVMDYLDRTFQNLQIHEQLTDEENKFYLYFLDLKQFVLERNEVENPNLRILEETLMQHLVGRGENSRGIVFVRTRALAESLASWLNRCENQKLRDLCACIFTGSNVPEEQGGTSQAKQEMIIQRFMSGEVKLIVATSVAEEGIDIPKCNVVVKYNHVGNEVTTVQTRGRNRAEGGISVLLATDNVLQKEFTNRNRAELMLRAIVHIRNMGQAEFQAAIENYQQQLYLSAIQAEMNEISRKQHFQNVPFKIVCPMCRRVSAPSSNIKTIYEKYRVSIDRNLLDQIKLYPRPQPQPMDGLFFVAWALCMGETRPGKKCFHQLGYMIKYKEIPFLAVGINNIAFQSNDQRDLKTYKQWKKVPYCIDELSYDDITRYLTETDVLARARCNGDDGNSSDSDD